MNKPLTDKEKLSLINKITHEPSYVGELTEYQLKIIYKHADSLITKIEMGALDMVNENPGFSIPEKYQGGHEWKFFLKSTGELKTIWELENVKRIIHRHLGEVNKTDLERAIEEFIQGYNNKYSNDAYIAYLLAFEKFRDYSTPRKKAVDEVRLNFPEIDNAYKSGGVLENLEVAWDEYKSRTKKT